MNAHATRHALTLADALRLVKDPNMEERLNMQKAFTDGFYNWEVRAQQWQVFLMSILETNQTVPSEKETVEDTDSSL